MANGYEVDRERLQRHLAQLRKCAGLSAEDVANRIGITKQAISLIETHQDRPMTKLQYIGIRSVFDEEIISQVDNINLIDCYDIVFSDQVFYDKNIQKINFAIEKMITDVNEYKKEKRAEIRREGGKEKKKSSKCVTSGMLVGATLGTIAVGGIACVVFPGFIPIGGMIIASRGLTGAVSKGASHAINDVGEKRRTKKRREGKINRASEKLRHTDWLGDVLEY